MDDTFTIIKYKKMLLEDGYLNADTSRKLQRLSVNYFPKETVSTATNIYFTSTSSTQ